MDAITMICRNCGGVIDLTETENHKPCAACGAENCRPQAEGDALDALRRATRQRLHCDFHRAESSYQHVLLDYPDEHEALWGVALCRYCVEYVDDPRTGRHMPTVHAVQDTLMQEDPDFLQACENAPEAIRAEYERDAAYIDDAQAEIRRLAQDRAPFDVFLCHKTTRPGEEEALTQDYTRGFHLYHMLDKAGYRVFFAPVEMEGVAAGENYEAGIYHALHTAKVMLVVCSDPEYLTSPWVQSEWKRFLRMMKPGAQKHLLPLLYGELSAGKLPREFRMRKLQAITMGEMGSAEHVMEAVARFVGRKAAGAESPFVTRETAGGVSIVKYAGPGGDVTIPAEIGGQRVVALEDKAFDGQTELRSIVIPGDVTRIGEFAFSKCSALQYVRLPENLVRIGDWAFYECGSLTAVTLPRRLAVLGNYAFRACRKLESIHLPESVHAIGCNPFACCDALHTLTVAPGNASYHAVDGALLTRSGALISHAPGYPAAVCALAEGVKIIGNRAFNGCARLTEIRLPQSVTNIGQSAFSGCAALREIVIPPAVRKIDAWLFTGCAALQSVEMEGAQIIGENAFNGCAALRDVKLPATVEQIHETAFTGCGALTLHVTDGTAAHAFARQHAIPCEVIPAYEPENLFQTETAGSGVCIVKYNGAGGEVLIPPAIGGRPVTEIGREAFKAQETLTKVVIPEGVKGIGAGAFSSCSALAEVSLPASLSSIDGNPFSNCRSLRTLSVAAGNPVYRTQENVLLTWTNGLICYPAGLAAAAYEIPRHVTDIGEAAFKGCSSLRRVRIPEGVMCIRGSTFYGCTGLTDVNIPEGVTNIMFWAFHGCSSLAAVRLPRSLTGIGNWAFDSCSSLAEVSVPASVAGVGYQAFNSCPRLTLVVDENTAAHEYARLNGVPFRLTPPPVQPQQPQRKHVSPPVQPQQPEWKPVPPPVQPRQPAENAAPHPVRKAPPGGRPAPSAIHAAAVSGNAADFATVPRMNGVEIVRYKGVQWEVIIPKEIYGKPVVGIGERAFEEQPNITTVRIPEGVRYIRSQAFLRCGMREITLPASLERIAEDAFWRCTRLSTVRVAEGNPVYHVRDGVLMDRSGTLCLCPVGMTLKEYTVPEDVRRIGGHAFSDNEALQKIVLNEGLTAIGMWAFAECWRLREIGLPDSLTSIDKRAFAHCQCLALLRLPDNIGQLDADAFTDCDAKLLIRRDSLTHRTARRCQTSNIALRRE